MNPEIKQTQQSCDAQKVCLGCSVRKDLSDFPKHPNGPFGRSARCKPCEAARMRERRKADPEAEKAKCREWRKRNPKSARDALYRWRAKNPEAFSRIESAYALRHKERLVLKRADRRKRNKNNPIWMLQMRITGAVRSCLREKRTTSKTLASLGYSMEELRTHIERQFTKGMDWSNIREWHIDHIVPKSSFNVIEIGDEEFKRCWALSNLRPLWATENLRKYNKAQYLC